MDLTREMWKQAFAWTAFIDAAECAREAVRRSGDGEPGAVEVRPARRAAGD